MDFLVVYIATLIYVAIKAFQQLSVMHHRLWWIPLGSYGMAYTELAYNFLGLGALFNIRAESGYSPEFWLTFLLLGAVYGTGGWNGCILSMFLHKRFRDGKPTT